MLRFLCILFVLGSVTSALADPASEMKDAVNRVRAAAGLPSVELDPALSAGCSNHTEYLRLNEGNPAIAGLGRTRNSPICPAPASREPPAARPRILHSSN